MRGLVVCVGYDDLLYLTLPRNLRFLDECVVITAPHDEKTKAICRQFRNVRVLQTDAFYRPDSTGKVPAFNKGLAVEEGFDFLGRDGWILVWDADTLLPENFAEEMPIDTLNPKCLYGCHRRILNDPTQWGPEFDWNQAPVTIDRCIPGYFQLFHADAPGLNSERVNGIPPRPWYNRTFSHCGGCDYYFEHHWLKRDRIKMPFYVLHLGPRDTNWHGRVSNRLDGETPENRDAARDQQERFLRHRGWAGRPRTREAVDDRVAITNDEESQFGF